jgi:hypothetical protein
MNSMATYYADSITKLKEYLGECADNNLVKSVLLMVADEGHPESEEIAPLLAAFPKPLIGAVFPELIHESQRVRTGFLLVPLAFKLKSAVFNLANKSDEYTELMEKIFGSPENKRKQNLFVFADALAENKNTFIHALFNYFGNTVKYLGGGAGSLSFKPFPCILHNSGIYQDAAVIGLFEKPLSIGVAHGWSPIGKPLRITKAVGNCIQGIDWAPAFETYKKWVEEHSGLTINEENFFDIAKSYPLGIIKLDSEMVIRDPFMVKNGELHIVDEVPEGEYVRIMNGNMDSLLKGAESALKIAKKNEKCVTGRMLFCFDCISRVLYMQDNFSKELDIITHDQKINGVLSIGEIANSGETFLEIYNKTIVIALWPQIV